MQSAESAPSQDRQQPNENISNTVQQLNYLVSESMQIYELENQKIIIINEIYNSLKTITEFLKFSISLHPLIFNLPGDTNISLLPNLDIIFRSSNGKTIIKQFNELSPNIVIKVLEYMIPQVLDLINTEKSDLINKVTFLREITKQLQETQMLKDHIKPEIEIGDSI